VVNNFLLGGNTRSGVRLDDLSTVHLSFGAVTGNLLGASVPALDPKWYEPLVDRVLYRDNDTLFAPR
jgi:hypothetical protein